MKKSIRISLVAALVVLGGVIYSPLASAQTTTETRTENQSTRCTIAQTRLNTRITQADTVKLAQTKVYTNLQERLNTLLTSADNAGYDIIALTAANDAVEESVALYTQKATAYTTALMATKNLSCGESDGEFTTSLVAARKALTETRSASLSVRLAFREKAIPALKDYALWLKDTSTTEERE